MQKTPRNNLYIGSKDDGIYPLWKVDLMHVPGLNDILLLICRLNDVPILSKKIT